MPNPTMSNSLLEKLPADVRSRFMAQAQHVELPLRTLLYGPNDRPKHVHFMTSGIASVVTRMSNGDAVEVGLVGQEGLPEALHLIGPGFPTSESVIQIPGSAFRMSLKRFQDEFYEQESFRTVVLEHLQYTTVLMGQLAACNRLHDVEERIARWLLMVADRTASASLTLTQEFLAEMIGSRRSTVTLAAGLLRQAGLIDHTRGEVRILDRARLEGSACECYQVSRTLLDGLMSSPAVTQSRLGSAYSHSAR